MLSKTLAVAVALVGMGFLGGVEAQAQQNGQNGNGRNQIGNNNRRNNVNNNNRRNNVNNNNGRNQIGNSKTGKSGKGSSIQDQDVPAKKGSSVQDQDTPRKVSSKAPRSKISKKPQQVKRVQQ
jgi:hypothetical protein